MQEISNRISKDIEKFDLSIGKLSNAALSKEESNIVALAKMYAEDAGSWLRKGDYYTAFSSISYAHGLLDAVLKLKHIIE